MNSELLDEIMKISHSIQNQTHMNKTMNHTQLIDYYDKQIIYNSNTETYEYLERKTEEPIQSKLPKCCICGLPRGSHTANTHKFFECSEKYKCKKCGKYFYQHNHCKNSCFDPHVRLSP